MNTVSVGFNLFLTRFIRILVMKVNRIYLCLYFFPSTAHGGSVRAGTR